MRICHLHGHLHPVGNWVACVRQGFIRVCHYVYMRFNALTFRDFVPRLELLTLFRDFRKSLKMCKMNHFGLFC